MSEQALAPTFFTTNETSGESAPAPATKSNSSSQPISFPSPPTSSANSSSASPVAQSPPQGPKTSPPLTFPPPSPTSSSGSDSPAPNPSPTHKSSSPPPSPPSNEPPPVSPPPPSPPPHDPVAPPALPFPPPNTNNQSSTPLTPPPTSKISPPPHSTPVTMSPPPNPLIATPSLPNVSPPSQVVIPPVPQTPPSTAPSPPLPLSPPNPSTPIINPPNQTTPVEPSPSTPSDSKPPESAPSPRDPDSSSSTSSSSSSSSHLTGSSWNVAVVVVAGVFVVAVVALAAIFFLVSRKKRRMNGLASQYRPPPSNFSIEPNNQYHKQSITTGHSSNSDIYYGSKPPSSPSAAENSYRSYGGHRYHAVFTYEELMGTTNGFSRENLIGEGGFGCVYKGCLPDGRTVAVKQLKVGSGQGEKEFRAEVEIISRVHHRHLVSLVGYCISEHHRLLLYEFVPNKTLEHHLHGKGLLAIDWPKRVKIAIGSARGLAYLHEDCHPRIIHRDIKSANILLDNSFEAQVADFGLAKLTNDAHTHVSTRVMGTFGCMAPEYASSGKLTDRSDVFSFGVVLLELITGRKPVDPSQPFGNESLVEWARPLLIRALDIGDYEELVDPRLENNFARSEMLRMIEVATACVRHSAPKRPRMVQVLRALDSEGDLADLSNGVKFGQSVVYDSSQYSAEILNFRRLALGSEEYSSDRTHSGSTAYSGASQSKEAPYTQLDTWRP